MKKLVVLLLALVCLAGCSAQMPKQAEVDPETVESILNQNHTEPPTMIFVDSKEELLELRKMSAADEKVLNEYLIKTSLGMNGVTGRQDLLDFLNLIDSLPIPLVSGAGFPDGVYYYPSHKNVNIHYTNKKGVNYSFTFQTDGADAEYNINLFEKKSSDIIYTDELNKITVYSHSEKDGSVDPDMNIYLMNVQGYFVIARIFSSNSAKDEFSNISYLPLKEIEMIAND